MQVYVNAWSGKLSSAAEVQVRPGAAAFRRVQGQDGQAGLPRDCCGYSRRQCGPVAHQGADSRAHGGMRCGGPEGGHGDGLMFKLGREPLLSPSLYLGQ